VKVRFTTRAQKRQRIVDRWWRQHGDDPNLFDEELEAALKQLERFPVIGTRYRKLEEEGVDLYRLLLKKTQQWVYYWIDRAAGEVVIHTIWATSRKRQP
jgi:hypothetical protein